MKNLLAAILLICSLTTFAQEEKTIKVYSKTVGKNTERKLMYYEMVNVVPIKSLGKGKHRFYIKSDEKCGLSVIADKSPGITEEELKLLNAFIAKHTIEYYDNDELIKDCNAFKDIPFAISLFIE